MSHGSKLLRIFPCLAVMMLLPAPSHADPHDQAAWSGWRWADGRLRLKPGVGLQLDATRFHQAGDVVEDVHFRRARVQVTGAIGEHVRLRVERELVAGAGWRNVWLSYDLSRTTSLRAGQFIAPVSLEDLQSSSGGGLVERSISNALAPGFGVGAQISYSGVHHTATLAYLTDGLDGQDKAAPTRGSGFSSRLTFSGLAVHKTRLHAGVGFDQRRLHPADRLRLSADAAGPFSPGLVRTPALFNVRSRTTYGAEAALLRGPVMLQAQYLVTDLGRQGRRTVHFDGGYAMMAWRISGPNYAYDRRKGMPVTPVGKDGRPVEVLARYSWIDLTSGSVEGGRAAAADLGASIQLTEAVKLSGGLTRTWHRTRWGVAGTRTDGVMTRLQFNF